MRFFTVSQEYLTYLKKHNMIKTDMCNVWGIPLRMGHFLYFLPFYASDCSDYDDQGNPRSSPPFLFRLIRNGKCEGKLIFSEMFPAPFDDIKETECHNPEILKLIDQQISRIQKAADRIYTQKIRNYNQPYLKYTNEFSQLEEFCVSYERKYYGTHINRFPDHHFFITQPDERITIRCTLCNQNTEVVVLEYNRHQECFIDIIQVKNEAFAPLECLKQNQLDIALVNRWFRGRGIPSFRDNLQQLLSNLNISNPSYLLSKAFGLSLSDQYWLKPDQMEIRWENINFFQNEFDDAVFPKATFDDKPVIRDSAFFTPDNTSDGMLKKAWIINSQGTRCLLKGSYRNSQMEPLCEVLASMIADNMNLSHVPYSLVLRNGNMLSSCPCFISKDTELITAWAIMKDNVNSMSAEKLYSAYVEKLEKHHVPDVKDHLAKMVILDYLIVNTDRHMGNFGIIRNVRDLSWVSMAPIFDSGMAMFSQHEIYQYDFEKPYGTFFTDKHMDFDRILSIATDSCNLNIPFDKLFSTALSWKSMLEMYHKEIHLPPEQIEALYQGLLKRIHKLQHFFCC